MFLLLCFCLSAGLTEKAVVEFFMKNFGGVGYVTCNRRLDFGGDPDLDHYADTGILREFLLLRDTGGESTIQEAIDELL